MEIIPYKSLGILSIGDTKQVARSKLRGSFIEFRKYPYDKDADAFNEEGLHLFYDSEGRLEFVEAFPPANVTYKGIQFLDRANDDVISDMQFLGITGMMDEDGCIFPEAGIASYAPRGIIESVSIYRKGYFD